MLSVSQLRDLESWDLDDAEIGRGYSLRYLEGYCSDARLTRSLRKIRVYEQRYSRNGPLFVQSITSRSKPITLSSSVGTALLGKSSSDLERSLVKTLHDLSTKRRCLPYVICDAYKPA